MIENFGIGYILKAPKSLIYNPKKTNDVLQYILNFSTSSPDIVLKKL